MYGMLCVLFGVAVWLILATIYGLPVSTTHSCIGGIIGMAVVAKGWSAVNWKQVGIVASSWIIAPVVSSLLSTCIFVIVRKVILRAPNSVNRALNAYSPIVGFTIAFNLFLVLYKSDSLQINLPIYYIILICIGIGAVVALVLQFTAMPFIRRYVMSVSTEPAIHNDAVEVKVDNGWKTTTEKAGDLTVMTSAPTNVIPLLDMSEEKALEEKYGEMARHPIVKMSKSLGNVINPDEVVDQYGADTMRLYEMFMGDFEQAAPWQTSAIAGCNRFLDRVWTLSDKLVEGEGYRPAIETLMHQTIKKVGADIEGLKMNTAIAQLMTLVNALYDNGGATKAELETVVQLLNPFAPHMTEELWEKLGHSHNEQLAYYPWPQYEEAKCVESTVEIAVQVNGKVKARLKVAADIDAAAAIAAAKADPAVAAALEGKQVVKEIYVKGRLVNLAVKG